MRTVISVVKLVAAYLVFLTLQGRDGPFLAQVIFFLLPAGVLGVFAKWLEHRRRRWLTAFRDRQAGELLDSVVAGDSRDEPIFLYLRPFSSTGRLMIENPKVAFSNAAMPGSYDVEYLEAESVLRDALDRFGTLVALGRPGEHYGAGRVVADEAEWRKTVELLADQAILIFLLPSDAPGTFWEIQHLRERGHFRKTVIVMPPAIASNGFSAAEEWTKARAKLADVGLQLPEHRPKGALFSLSDGEWKFALIGWMTWKERKLRRALQRLAGAAGVTLAPRLAAGRRTDAPVPPALVWLLVFSLITWYAGSGWPSWGGGDSFTVTAHRIAHAMWVLSAITIGLLLFLFLESTYGRLTRTAFVLLAVFAIYSTSPYSFLPFFRWLDVGPWWLSLPVLIRAAVIGLLLGRLLRELVPGGFEVSRVVVLAVGCVLAVALFEHVVWRNVTERLGLGLNLPHTILIGLLFGLGLPRAMKSDPWISQRTVPGPLGVEGFFIGWAVVGYALLQMGWGRGGALWVALGLAGAVAQCFGWHRQGWPIARSRAVLLVICWGITAGAAMSLANWIWSWRRRSVLGTYWQNPNDPWNEGLIGLAFGVVAALFAVLLRHGLARFRTSAIRQAAFLGVGFGVVGMLGAYDADPGMYAGSGMASPPLTIVLATVMATAAYLDVRAAAPRRAHARVSVSDHDET